MPKAKLPEDDEEEFEEEVGPSSVDPDIVSECIKLMRNSQYEKITFSYSLRAIEQDDKIIKFCEENNVTVKNMAEALRKYYSTALSQKRLRCFEALDKIEEYNNGGSSVQLYSDFPVPPKNPYQAYLNEHKVTSFSITEKQRKEYNDPETKRNLSEKHAEELALFVDQLKAFLEKHELTSEREKYVKKIIYSKEKQNGIGSPKPKRQRKVEERKTAFDFYKQTMKAKYTDLDAAERERKLQKKYKKLDEVSKSIFQQLEETQQ